MDEATEEPLSHVGDDQASIGGVTPPLPDVLRRQGLALRLLPFAIPLVVAFGTAPLTEGPTQSTSQLWAAVGLLVALLVAVVVVPWHRLPRPAGNVLWVGFIAMIAILRNAEGGSASGLSALYFLPLIGAALYGMLREVYAVIVCIAVALVLPIIAVGSPHYPGTEWRRAVLQLLMMAFIGTMVQTLVQEGRLQLVRERSVQRSLRESRALLRSIMDNTPAVIYTKDPDGRYLFVNERFKRIFNISNEEIRGKGDDAIFDDSTAREIAQIDSDVLKGSVPIDLERDGYGSARDRHYLSVKFPVIDKAGEVLGMCDVSLDITDRKQAQAAAERVKDEFFSLVSHELRTPLTSIVGYVEELLSEEDGDLNSVQRRFLEVIRRNSERLHRLVGDLLFVAQAEAGAVSLVLSDIVIHDVAARSVEAALPHARSKSIDLTFDSDPGLVVSGDGGRIGQLFDNLISNAIKYTPEGGKVQVSLRRDGEQVVIDVSDTGMGIPEDEQPLLFQRFSRTRASKEKQIKGVGLGLTIAKSIAEAHGGSIELRSAVGHGTTFTTRLPVAEKKELPL
ncbi:MAG: sensor histidine kinase [Actinomycetota bacterium]